MLGVNAAPSFASASCSVHRSLVTGSDQPHQLSVLWDFQCGGALDVDYYLSQTLQYYNNPGYLTAQCQVSACTSRRPSSGYFNGGSSHFDTGAYNVTVPSVLCPSAVYRYKTVVHFKNGDPTITYGTDPWDIWSC